MRVRDVEGVRRFCEKALSREYERGKLDRRYYDLLRELNDEIATILTRALHWGEKLKEWGLADSAGELLSLVERPSREADAVGAMLRLIEEGRGRVRYRAKELFKRALKRVMPEGTTGLISYHYALAGRRLEELKPEDERALRAVKEGAWEIYDFVKKEVEYLDERGEYLQPALTTLEVIKAGDCDDQTILLCSLWESIGFETTVNVVEDRSENHCFPGVKLALPSEERGEVVIFNVRADPILADDMFDLSYRLCRGEDVFKGMDGRRRELFAKLYYEARSYPVPPAERAYEEVPPPPMLRRYLCEGIAELVNERPEDLSLAIRAGRALGYPEDKLRKIQFAYDWLRGERIVR